MNRKLRSVVPVVLAIAVLAACSAPLDRQAFDTLKIMTASVDAAMTIANSQLEAGKITEAQARNLAVDYDVFILARDTALAALKALATSGQPITQSAVDEVMVAPTLAKARITLVVGVK